MYRCESALVCAKQCEHFRPSRYSLPTEIQIPIPFYGGGNRLRESAFLQGPSRGTCPPQPARQTSALMCLPYVTIFLRTKALLSISL